MKRFITLCALSIALVLATPLRAELISASSFVALPGETRSMLFTLSDSVTPLIGYSLDIDVEPVGGAVGTINVNILLTNFFDSQNLITAGGLTRDPDFSIIEASGNGGVFINTITSDLSAVIAVPGINDVLAQVFFDISPDALGVFTVDLGPATALSDAKAFPVEYGFSTATITIVPEPNSILLVTACVAGYLSRRNRREKSVRGGA